MCIPSRKCFSSCWRTVPPINIVMHSTTIVAPGSIEHSMKYEPKPIPTWGSNSRCLGEIWQFESPLLVVWGILSVPSVNIDKIWISSMNFLCELTIGIPRLPCLFSMANADSSTVELVNSVTSDCVSLCNFVICAFASKCFQIELVPCSEGWRRTWWQTIHMMPGLPVASILQCK